MIKPAFIRFTSPSILTTLKANMSTTAATSTATGASRSITKSVYAHEVSEGAGATVRRSIGTRELRNLTPFLMWVTFNFWATKLPILDIDTQRWRTSPKCIVNLTQYSCTNFVPQARSFQSPSRCWFSRSPPPRYADCYLLVPRYLQARGLHSYLSLTPGDVQWMTAGRGIAHAEMPIFDPDPAKAEPVEGMQLWIDLPQKDKYIEPEYQDRKAEE